MTTNDFEKHLSVPGSLEKQGVVLLRFGLTNKFFELLTTCQTYMGAYEFRMRFGLTEDSIQLLNENILLKDLKGGQGVQLNTV